MRKLSLFDYRYSVLSRFKAQTQSSHNTTPFLSSLFFSTEQTHNPTRPDPPPIRVGLTESSGRGVFATRLIVAGDLIHTAKPVVCHPSFSAIEKVCYFCLGNLDNPCGDRSRRPSFCGKECEEQAKMEQGFELLKSAFQSNVPNERTTFLTKQWYTGILSRIRINAFRVELAIGGLYEDLLSAAAASVEAQPAAGNAVYMLPSFYNHDCDPNAHILWIKKADARLTALRDVGEGPENVSSEDNSKLFDDLASIEPMESPDASNSAAIISVLTQQRSKSRWGNLRSLCPNGFEPEEFSRVTLGIRNNPHLALRFFNWTRQNSLCEHNLATYSTIIHVLARGRLRNHARVLIKEAFIRVCGTGDLESDSNPMKLFETLVKTYTQCGSAPFVFDLLIESCLQSKKIADAIKITRMLLSRGIIPRLGTCNAVIRRVSRFHGADKGYGLYNEIFGTRNSRARPSVEILNTLMVAFYQENMLERVREIWDETIELGCEPNCFSFSILMAAYCDEGRMEKAEGLWEEMKAKGVEFDVMAYNTIISGFCRTGEVEKAEEFFKEMELNGIEGTCATYEHLINGHCNTGNVNSAMLVYRDSLRRGFRVESLTVHGLIKELCDVNRVSEALKVWKCASGHSGFCWRKESFVVLITGFCREGKMDEALKLQAEMVSKGFEPNSEIYDAFILGYEDKGNVEMAGILRKEMQEIGWFLPF